MVIVSLVLLALTLLVIAAGLHLGPHSSVGAGVSSFVVAGVAVSVLASRTSSITTLTLLIYGLIFLISLGTIALGLKGVLSKPKTSPPQRYKSLLGRTGVASTDLAPSGTVTVDGESWSADALEGVISKGDNIFVVEANQIHLKVAIDTFNTSTSTSVELNESTGKENNNGKDDH
jgi:membrane protein implicated in regulation of membrane protease activity